jgi:type I restriction enzyme S subunit
MGRFPVVDQGQALIAGFTDDETSVHRTDLPLIVFGDHTRAVKFADFPFATGADGTKLLRPRSNAIDARFLYYALLNIELPSRGYNRHFGLLRENHVDLPRDPEEQRGIAGVLSKLQARVEIQERVVARLKELKTAAMAKLFREGVRGEPLKQTEIGEIPESWGVRRIGDPAFATTRSGGTPYRGNAAYYGGGIPWVKSGELRDAVITRTDETISEEGLRKSSARRLPPGALLVAMYGATAGMTGILGVTAAINQAICAILPVGDSFHPEFLRHYLVFTRPQLLAERRGGAQPNVSQAIVRNLLVPAPLIADQRRIGNRLEAISRVIEAAEHRRLLLHRLFRSALEVLVTGTVRVDERPSLRNRSDVLEGKKDV